jgi:predicted DCC family thiol-disulfide oxidoreductase YuxK
MLAAYTAVGRGWMVAPLRLRVLRPLFSALYRGFARNRYRISGWLGQPACVDGVCANKQPWR